MGAKERGALMFIIQHPIFAVVVCGAVCIGRWMYEQFVNAEYDPHDEGWR